MGSYDPSSSHKLVKQSEALKKAQLQSKLAAELNSRLSEDEMHDAGYLKYKGKRMSQHFHPIAVALEDKIKTRVDDDYLRNQGILYKNNVDAVGSMLDDKIKSRPSIGALEQSGIAPHGVFHDVDAAMRGKHDRVQ